MMVGRITVILLFGLSGRDTKSHYIWWVVWSLHILFRFSRRDTKKYCKNYVGINRKLLIYIKIICDTIVWNSGFIKRSSTKTICFQTESGRKLIRWFCCVNVCISIILRSQIPQLYLAEVIISLISRQSVYNVRYFPCKTRNILKLITLYYNKYVNLCKQLVYPISF